jgi:hypothetical protein
MDENTFRSPTGSMHEPEPDELAALRARNADLERERDDALKALAEEMKVSRARKQAADNQEQMLSDAKAENTRLRAAFDEWRGLAYQIQGDYFVAKRYYAHFTDAERRGRGLDRCWALDQKYSPAALTHTAAPHSGPGVHDYTKVIDAAAKQPQAAQQPLRSDIPPESAKLKLACTKEEFMDGIREGFMLAREEKHGDARVYPCVKCGKPLSKAEGGTTFTVCDDCWDATQDGHEGGRP